MVLNCEGLRLFLDSAEVGQWKRWLPTGLFYGVTTNPLLLRKAHIPCTVAQLRDLAHQAFELGAHEVHLQTWGPKSLTMVQTGALLATDYPERSQGTIDNRIVIKIPATQVGAEAAARLVKKRIRVTLTGVYHSHQVLIGAALGTDYVAPYLGRINDLGRDGRQELVNMARSVATLKSQTRILVASVRQIEDIAFLTTQGLNTFTCSPAVAEAFFDVEATNQMAEVFEQAVQG
jgi:transaldolase